MYICLSSMSFPTSRVFKFCLLQVVFMNLLQANVLSEVSTTNSLQLDFNTNSYPDVSCAITLMEFYFTYCYSVNVYLHDKSLQGYEYFHELQMAVGKEQRWPLYVVRYRNDIYVPFTSNCTVIISLDFKIYDIHQHIYYEREKLIIITALNETIIRNNLNKISDFFIAYNVRILILFNNEEHKCKVLHDTFDEFRTDSLEIGDYSYLQEQFNNEESDAYTRKLFSKFNILILDNSLNQSAVFERDIINILFDSSMYYQKNKTNISFYLPMPTGYDILKSCDIFSRKFFPTFPFGYSPDALYVPISKPLGQWWAMILIFQTSTWILIAILFLFCIIIWLLLLRLYKEFPRQQNLLYSFITNLCLLLGASSNHRPKHHILQMFFAVVALYSMHLTTAYLSNWIFILTIPIKNVQIRTRSDMIAAGIKVYKCPINICDCNLFLLHHSQEGYPSNVAISCKRVEMILSNQGSSWFEITDSFKTNYLSTCIRNRVIKREIDKNTLLVHANGILAKKAAERRFTHAIQNFQKKKLTDFQDDNIPQKLSVLHLQGGFIILVMGLATGLIIFVVEVCRHKIYKRWQITLPN